MKQFCALISSFIFNLIFIEFMKRKEKRKKKRKAHGIDAWKGSLSRQRA